MEHDRVEFDIKNASSLKLLRSDNAPLIISFLYRQFKHFHRIAIPHAELVEKLEDYLEVLRENQPELYPQPAQTYLDTWCNDNHQFLKNYYETNTDEPIFELTTGTEKAIRWLEELNKSEFIGTESRFLQIFALLEEIRDKSTEDIDARLTQLEKQKADIQKEIDTIRQTGEVERYNVTQIQERFLLANDMARQLIADFKAVEQKFRDIARDVRKAQLEEGTRKGSVVAHVLDSDEALKKSDQGRSFYAFWNFLMLDSKREELRILLNSVYGLTDLQSLSGENQILRRIERSLIDAGERIVQSNHRLAEQLRKVLDEQNLAESRRVLELITDIKRLALEMLDNPPVKEDFIWLEGQPEVRLVMERPLWEPANEPDFNSHALSLGSEDLSSVNMDDLYNQFYVDEAALKRQIEMMLERQHQVTLAELTERYPVQKGLSEIIVYFAIASQDEKHLIGDSVCEHITLRSSESGNIIRLTLPQVVFIR